ncbi:MAG TPA: hypothetical protein VIM70_11465 [Clostridium sp.]|uniref:hypothetical protein n=1 Tax=Clostridium sp. TaxID=1506 RepID=UPI002F95F0AC
MKIISAYNLIYNSFKGDLECEFCHDIVKGYRCFDSYTFHEIVIPNMVCKKCGMKSGRRNGNE